VALLRRLGRVATRLDHHCSHSDVAIYHWYHPFMRDLCLMLTALLAGLGIITCYQIAQPNLTIASLGTVNYNLAFWAIAVSLNMLLSAIITIRLMSARKHVVSVLGKHFGDTYTNSVAIIIESAVPYAIFGLLWIATYGSHHPSAPMFLPILLQVEVSAAEG
jgi:hypothetical protein